MKDSIEKAVSEMLDAQGVQRVVGKRRPGGGWRVEISDGTDKTGSGAGEELIDALASAAVNLQRKDG